MVENALKQNPRSAHTAHVWAHALYEAGEDKVVADYSENGCRITLLITTLAATAGGISVYRNECLESMKAFYQYTSNTVHQKFPLVPQ